MATSTRSSLDQLKPRMRRQDVYISLRGLQNLLRQEAERSQRDGQSPEVATALDRIRMDLGRLF